MYVFNKTKIERENISENNSKDETFKFHSSVFANNEIITKF